MMKKDIETVAPVLLTTIVDRGEGDRVAGIFSANDAYFNMLTLGYGTARKKILSYFGLGETEKDVIFSYMPFEASQAVLKELTGLFKVERAGYGVAFSVPMNGAADAIQRMGCEECAEERGGRILENHEHDLIIAITAQGYVDEVMDVARAHGATGGTVLRARGVGAKEAEKFFGIAIQAEKDMIMIVVRNDKRLEMMNAIIEKKGPASDARTVVFSLPVSGVAGMSFIPWNEKK